ncbi:MAG: hypothetical protein MJ252_08785 [archaeon]|nr:hypothetical protein [archaeon]
MRYRNDVILFRTLYLVQIFNEITRKISLISLSMIDDNYPMIIQRLKENVEACIECLDFEEDPCAKEDNYSKYELKPSLIPNSKMCCKDKTIDIFPFLQFIRQIYLCYENCLTYCINKGEDPEDAVILIKLLQKLAVLKPFYLGENKNDLLTVILDCLTSFFQKNFSMIHHPHICRLIFMLKKDFTVPELLSCPNFLNGLVGFIENTIKSTGDYPGEFFEGLIYLLRFLGYYSNFSKLSKNQNGPQLISVISDLLSTNIFNRINFASLTEGDEFEDFCEAFGEAGVCAFNPIFSKIVSFIKEEGKKLFGGNNQGEQPIQENNQSKVSFSESFFSVAQENPPSNSEKVAAGIILGCELLNHKKNQLYIKKLLISKDNKSKTPKINEDEKQSITLTYEFITEIFRLIPDSIFTCDNFFSYSLIKFLNFFIENFFRDDLADSFDNIFPEINLSIKANNTSEFLFVILNALLQLSVRFGFKEIRILNLIQSTMSFLIEKFNPEIISSNEIIQIEDMPFVQQRTEIQLNIGKIVLLSGELRENLDKLFLYFSQIEEVRNYKICNSFLELIFKVYSLSSPSIDSYINLVLAKLEDIINVNSHNPNIPYETNLEFILKMLRSFENSIFRQNDFETFVERILPFVQKHFIDYFLQSNFTPYDKMNNPNSNCGFTKVHLKILKFLVGLTENKYNRINFSTVSNSPGNLFNIMKNLLIHFEKIWTVEINKIKESQNNIIQNAFEQNDSSFNMPSPPHNTQGSNPFNSDTKSFPMRLSIGGKTKISYTQEVSNNIFCMNNSLCDNSFVNESKFSNENTTKRVFGNETPMPKTSMSQKEHQSPITPSLDKEIQKAFYGNSMMDQSNLNQSINIGTDNKQVNTFNENLPFPQFPNENEKLMFLIKPIGYFLKIFKNISYFVQLTNIYNFNYDFLKEVFNSFLNLMSLIPMKEICIYSKYFSEYFYFLKIIYSDFVKFDQSLLDNEKIKKLLELMKICLMDEIHCEPYMRCLNDILFDWGKYFLKQQQIQISPGYSELLGRIFNQENQGIFKEIMMTFFNYYNESINQVGIPDDLDWMRGLFILTYIYKDTYFEVVNTYANTMCYKEEENLKIKGSILAFRDEEYFNTQDINNSLSAFIGKIKQTKGIIKDIIGANVHFLEKSTVNSQIRVTFGIPALGSNIKNAFGVPPNQPKGGA